MRILICTLILASCAAPNHLGNPLTLPIRGVLAGIENGSYNARRGRVKGYIMTNETGLKSEGFGGPLTAELLQNIPVGSHPRVQQELRDAATHPDFVERATVIVMVHMG